MQKWLLIRHCVTKQLAFCTVIGLAYWVVSWWRHQMETFSALLAICAGNSPVPGEFPTQRPVTRSFDVYFDLRPNKRLSEQSWGWWFETPSRSLWRHRNDGNNNQIDPKHPPTHLLSLELHTWRRQVMGTFSASGKGSFPTQRASNPELSCFICC